MLLYTLATIKSNLCYLILLLWLAIRWFLQLYWICFNFIDNNGNPWKAIILDCKQERNYHFKITKFYQLCPIPSTKELLSMGIDECTLILKFFNEEISFPKKSSNSIYYSMLRINNIKNKLYILYPLPKVIDLEDSFGDISFERLFNEIIAIK